MIYNNCLSRTQRQRGMSLIEVMVAMTIGLIILAALGYFFISSNQINRSTDDVSRMQENGRNALELMGRAIRQAGYRVDVDKAFSGAALAGVDGASGATDSITVQYDAQEGGDVDCTGSAVASGLVTAVFAISGNALTCNNGTTTVTVVDNIEDMQISYAIDAAKDGTIDSAYIDSPTAAQLGQVAAVRVTLLTKGFNANVAANKTQTLTYNGTSVTKTDGFLRQVYSATFTVRNQAW